LYTGDPQCGSALFLGLARQGPWRQSSVADGLPRGGGAPGLAQRHILTDTGGLLVTARVHTADIQDRDGAPDVLTAIRSSFPWLRHVFADGGYAGDKLRHAMAGRGDWKIEIIKRSDTAKGLVLLPRRWVVERTFAWLGRNRRLAKDFEKSLDSSTAWLFMSLGPAHDPKARNPLITIRNIMSQTLRQVAFASGMKFHSGVD